MIRTLLLIIQIALFQTVTSSAQNRKDIIYVSSNPDQGNKSINVFELDRSTGRLKLIQSVPNNLSPIYVELHPSGKFLYSANIGSQDTDQKSGSLSSYKIDQSTGKLTFLNNVLSLGAEPCHITLRSGGKWAVVSNYGGGNIAVFPIEKDGSIGKNSDFKAFSGKSVNKRRQESSHIHSTTFSPDSKFIYASDLGTDQISMLKFDSIKGKLELAEPASVRVKAGAGPRHFVFHPNGKYAYSSEELFSSVCAFRYNKGNGALSILKDSIRSLPLTFKEENTSADITIDPSGKFLYMSNRGLNAIAIYSIQEDGNLHFVKNISTHGSSPRGFLLDKKGKYFFVGNQKSDNISIYIRDEATGKLIYKGLQANVTAPICLKLLQLK